MPLDEELQELNEKFSFKKVFRFVLGLDGEEKPITKDEIDKEKEKLEKEKVETNDSINSYPFHELMNYRSIRISKPKTVEDCNYLINIIKEGKVIIVDFSELESRTAENLFFYFCGACYSIEGHVYRISGNLCLFSGKQTIVVTDM